MLRAFVVDFYRLEIKILKVSVWWLCIYIYDYISNKAILTLAGCFYKQAGIIFFEVISC